jgi:hypothetical protein
MTDSGRPPLEFSEKPVTNVKTISMGEVLKQHRMHYVLHLSIGDMVFKHIGRLKRDEVSDALSSKYPEYDSLRAEFSQLYELSGGDSDGLGPAELQRLRELDRQLRPYSHCYSLPCIVSPTIETVEELDALLSLLPAQESNAVLELLAALNSPRDVALSPDGVLLIQELKLPLPADLTIETITAEQAQAFMAGAAEVGKQAQAALKGALNRNG